MAPGARLAGREPYVFEVAIVAFVSLVVSDIRPVMDFGWMMSIGLSLAMLRQATPRGDGRLVPEERQRQQLARGRQTLEPLHADEAVEGLQLLRQRGRLGQVGSPPRIASRLDLEDDRDHRPGPVSGFRNRRSS